MSADTDVNHYDYESWRYILNVFAMRASCLFDSRDVVEYDFYRKYVTPRSVYKKQKEFLMEGKAFVLSAFPEFILDYYSLGFWKANITYKHLRHSKVIKECRR